MQVLCGAATEILKDLPENSIDVVYTCPSPFGYYENNPEKIGGEKNIEYYIYSIKKICDACKPVLKKSGSLFVQVPDVFTPYGNLASIPIYFEAHMVHYDWILNDRLIWYRTETNRKPPKPESGFIKNYEMIFHFVVNEDHFYFNEKSKFAKTSVFSYPLEDSYYTNEFDSGLPEQLFRMVIDTSCPPKGIVMDPLCGSGKLGVVAKKMERDFIGIDIDPEIVNLCKIRLGI